MTQILPIKFQEHLQVGAAAGPGGGGTPGCCRARTVENILEILSIL
jgi:hypothetical protein